MSWKCEKCGEQVDGIDENGVAIQCKDDGTECKDLDCPHREVEEDPGDPDYSTDRDPDVQAIYLRGDE